MLEVNQIFFFLYSSCYRYLCNRHDIAMQQICIGIGWKFGKLIDINLRFNRLTEYGIWYYVDSKKSKVSEGYSQFLFHNFTIFEYS